MSSWADLFKKPQQNTDAASVAKPAEKPAVKPAEKPAVKPAEKPAVKPAEKPAVKPAEKPEPEPNTVSLGILIQNAMVRAGKPKPSGFNTTFPRPWQLINSGKPCLQGQKCQNKTCSFDHKDDCPNKWRCDVAACQLRHPTECMYGHFCTWDQCTLAHQADIYPERWNIFAEKQ